MASYDNLVAEQPWAPFRPAFADAWVSDVFAKETETLAKALQSSFAGDGGDAVFPAGMMESLFAANPDTTPLQTPTASGGSEPEIPPSTKHQRRSGLPPSGGRVAKRKPRTSKRAATTTFITADPANFRQMVQQVTGVKFGGASGPVFVPEPRSAAVALLQHGGGGGGLPTLDTSAFLLDGGSASSALAEGGGAAASENYLGPVCSFPTLESWSSWKAM